MNMTEKLKFVLLRVENVGKEEKPSYQHFLLLPRCFQKASLLRVIKSWDYVVELTYHENDTIKKHQLKVVENSANRYFS